MQKKHNTKIAFTFSDIFVVQVFRDIVSEISNSTDLVFCNDAEACAFTGQDSENAAFQALIKVFPHVVMTKGKKGADIFYNGQHAVIPANMSPAPVVSTAVVS